MAHYTPKSYKAVSVKEFNKWLSYCNKYRKMIDGPKPANQHVSLRAYLEVKEVEIWLTFKYADKVCTYITRLDEGTVSIPSGLKAWQEVNKYYNVPRAKFPSENQYSASAILGYNEKLTGNRYENCYAYDINSAYTWGMIQDLPDTSVKPDRCRKVKKGEIGFDIHYNLVFEGKIASFIYPKMESPFKKFAEIWYNKKKNAKTKEEKQLAKNVLNCAVGYFQKTNPILRTAIIWYANERIKKLIDENTLYWNTDSIISRTRRYDIEKELGLELGQFKLEHIGTFAFKGFNYQWNLETPTYRGIPKSWFKPGWDIMKDSIPKDGNKYFYNKDTKQIEEVQ